MIDNIKSDRRSEAMAWNMNELKKWKGDDKRENEACVSRVTDEVKHDLLKPIMSLELLLSSRVKESR
jgi:hypothetical protein